MIARSDVEAAARRIAPHVRRTPVLHLAKGEAAAHGAIALKLEHLQHTGSFKARGAFNRMLKLPGAARVVTASGGNHGAAVAYAASKLGAEAEVFVPTFAPEAKRRRIEALGAKVVVVEGDFGDVLAASRAREREGGFAYVHAYDDPDVIEGQGTATLEFLDQAPFDTVLIAIGGGGLAGGAAAALDGRARIIAVETEGTPAFHVALSKGAPTPVQVGGLAADALGAKEIGAHAFALLKAAQAQSVLVSDDDVRAALDWLWSKVRIAAEPGGATAFAALWSGAYTPAPDERVGIFICGANSDLSWMR